MATFLSGWKEFSVFLNKSVRTSQRLERWSGMPIHRLGSDGGVLAIPKELEDWVQTITAKLPASAVDQLKARIVLLEAEIRSLRDRLKVNERIEVPQEFAALDAGIKVRLARANELVAESDLVCRMTTDLLASSRPSLNLNF